MQELTQTYKISIHALREEGDQHPPFYACPLNYFYPRPPRGGRRAASKNWDDPKDISIHALREEGDSTLHKSNEGL